ncbi:MAG: tRNA uridine-5-carboxymethylaminomethyl(34) synthesis GTPase MnmE [Burkholderiales bacterium]|nr:tRNA uridine-5-carboxymethylaminomethyl(34) synthesis GTPase MnmE [Burkholderiales bacterium]
MKVPEIIAAIATAPGRAGVGMVRLSGRGLGTVMRGLIGRDLTPRRATLVNFLDDAGEVLDRGIALYFPAPHSYTGEDVLELQGHGSPVVLGELLRCCTMLGARIAEPGEFTKRAFLNGKLDLAQAEAVADLIDASTARAARAAFQSLQGEFSERIGELEVQLNELRVLVEAGLDFPEEDLEDLAHEQITTRLCQVSHCVSNVLAGTRKGALLREGFRVIIAGQPNVGKSSLLNRLAREELALVTAVPGTTRDAIRVSVEMAGVPVHFIDTAGLRASQDPVERLGIERAWSLLTGADAVVLIMDATRGESEMDREILARLPGGVPIVKAMNKIDLIGRTPALECDEAGKTVWLSARSGAGLDLLQEGLLGLVRWGDEGQGLYMARARHIDALERVLVNLQRAGKVATQPELFAEDLRQAQDALGEITGKRTSDDLLGDIFSRFCIGK